MEEISREIGPDDVGRRLDQFLTSLDAALSRAEVQRQIRDGRVSIDKRPAAQPSRRLRLGERVIWLRATPALLTPHALPLDLVYEDDALLALHKPAGLVVHPGAGTAGATTLVEALLASRSLPASDDAARPGIVHRIDKETAGILVVAKTPQALDSLKRQFATRTVEKQYLAWVGGSFEELDGVIDAPVGRDPSSPRRMAVTPDGRPSETEFHVLERRVNRTLLLVRPRTGRTHQIRVHFRYIGHPVVGDRLYGGPPAPTLLLHAWTLSLHHPVTGARLTFVAPPPAVFPRGAYEPFLPSEIAATR